MRSLCMFVLVVIFDLCGGQTLVLVIFVLLRGRELVVQVVDQHIGDLFGRLVENSVFADLQNCIRGRVELGSAESRGQRLRGILWY